MLISLLIFACDDNDKKITGGSNDNDTVTDSIPLVTDSVYYENLDPMLSYDFFQDTSITHLTNNGNINGSFNITFGSPFFSVDSIYDSAPLADTFEISLVLDRSQIPSDTMPIETYMLIQSEEKVTDSIPIFISNYVTDIWKFDFKTVDAEYSRALDKIILVSTDPNQIHLIDPHNKQVQTMDMILSSRCVTITSDGQYAASGHDGYISYYNVSTWEREKVLFATEEVGDIILPSNGWVYAVPSRSSLNPYTRVRSINLENNYETGNGGFSTATYTFRLHPSKKYIYGADLFTTSMYLTKFDLTRDTLYTMYKSPYSAFPTDGNLWISEDGTRIYTKGGAAISCSENEEEDMQFIGTYAGGYRGVNWLVDSEAAGRIFFLGFKLLGSAPNNLYVVDRESLEYYGYVILMRDLVQNGPYSGKLYPMIAKFAFTNNAGTELYVLGNYEYESGQAFDWGMVTYQIKDLPGYNQ